MADFEVDGVGVGHLAAWDGDIRGAVLEGEWLDRGGVDSGYAGFSAGGKGNGGCCDGEVAAAKGVADLDAETFGPDGEVEGLAEGGVFEDASA